MRLPFVKCDAQYIFIHMFSVKLFFAKDVNIWHVVKQIDVA